MYTKVALVESFLAFGIRIPQISIKEDASMRDSTYWKKKIYDAHYLAECLRGLGMKATLPIPLEKKTKFTDPISKIQCSIGVDDGLLYERDALISEYMKLDNRIRPLIIVILYFSRLQMINKCKCCQYGINKKLFIYIFFFSCP